MSYFLWIEDFASVTGGEDIADSVLGGIIDPAKLLGDKKALRRDLKSEGVFIELNFGDGLDFIQDKLADIDYIILDINLPAYPGSEPKDNVLRLLKKWHGYKATDDGIIDENTIVAAAKALQEIAGYHLYTELIFNLGFPKENILFCSNHGKDLESIVKAFNVAKIELPQIHKKEDKDDVQAWVKSRYENPYSRLRRGIIEGCRYIKTLSEDNLRFNDFIKDSEKRVRLEDLHDYLEVLEKFLPLISCGNNDTATLYKLFIRILAHEWEAAEPKQLNGQKELYAFAWTMKMTRNWLAHSKVFEQLASQDVAYLFIVNMRAMFDLGDDLLPYEKHLLSLFSNVISAEEMTDRIGDNPKKRNDRNPTGRNIPLVENYALLLKATGNTWQAINYHDALNNLQKNKDKVSDSELLIKGLYQTFWFLTSSGGVYIPPNDEQIKDFAALNYQFKHFDYKKPEYIFELARHIYTRCFS